MAGNVFELYATINLNDTEYKGKLREAESATEQTASNISARTVAIGQIAGRIAEKGAEFFVNLARTGVQYNAQIESYTVALTTALGDEAAAAAAIEQIKKDAAATPYNVDGLVKANSYLIAAGESAEDARATIMALSDAVSATGGGNEELQRMAQNLQQIKNVGKATSMDIRQFAMAGIDVYGILADYLGTTTAQVQEMTISYDMLSGALQNAASEGGRYFEANIRQSQTLNGQISTLRDNVDSKLGEAFKSVADKLSGDLLPAANRFVQGLNVDAAISGFRKFVDVLAAVGVAFAGIKIATFVAGLTSAGSAFMALTAGMTVSARLAGVLSGEFSALGLVSALLTGQIGGAAVATAALNAAMAALPLVAVAGFAYTAIQVIRGIKESSEESAAAVQELRDSFEGLIPEESIDELVALQEEMQSVRSEIDATNAIIANGIDYDGSAAAKIDELEAKLAELEQAYSDLASTAMTESAGFSEGLSNIGVEAAQAMIEWQQTTQENLTAWQEAYTKTYDSIAKNVNKWFGLFDEAKVSVKANINDMMTAMQSQIDFNSSYSSNLDKLASYDLPQVAEAFQGMGEEGAAYAEALVAAVEDAGGATSTGGQQIIENFRALSDGVAESREQLTESLTNVTGEFDAAMQGLVESAEGAVADMNLGPEASAAASDMINAYIAAIAAGEGPAAAAAARVAAAAAGALGSVGAPKGGLRVLATPMAVGSDYIPYDNYPALLHKGEMVIPAKISEDLRDFVTSGGGDPAVGGGDSLMGEVVNLLTAILHKDSGMYLDGERVSELLAPSSDRALGEINGWRGRGLSLA